MNDKRNGKGTYYYVNKNIYTGNWINGTMVGQGVFIWSHGDRYERKVSQAKWAYFDMPLNRK